MIILLFVTLALVYTYWCMLSSAIKDLQLHWFLATLATILFIGLSGGLLFIFYLLSVAGTINPGSLLGMLFGISLILATIRTFTH